MSVEAREKMLNLQILWRKTIRWSIYVIIGHLCLVIDEVDIQAANGAHYGEFVEVKRKM